MLKVKKIHTDFYKNRILEKFASVDPIPITLKQLTQFGSNVNTVANLLHSGNFILTRQLYTQRTACTARASDTDVSTAPFRSRNQP
jgi:hypothetical protein